MFDGTIHWFTLDSEYVWNGLVDNAVPVAVSLAKEIVHEAQLKYPMDKVGYVIK